MAQCGRLATADSSPRIRWADVVDSDEEGSGACEEPTQWGTTKVMQHLVPAAHSPVASSTNAIAGVASFRNGMPLPTEVCAKNTVLHVVEKSGATKPRSNFMPPPTTTAPMADDDGDSRRPVRADQAGAPTTTSFAQRAAALKGKVSSAHTATVVAAYQSLQRDGLVANCARLRRRVHDGCSRADRRRWSDAFLFAASKVAGLPVEEAPPKAGTRFIVGDRSASGPCRLVGQGVQARVREFIEAAEDRWDEVAEDVTSDQKAALLLQRRDVAGTGACALGDIAALVHILVKEKVLGHRKEKRTGKSYLVPYGRSDEHAQKMKADAYEGDRGELWAQVKAFVVGVLEEHGEVLLSTLPARLSRLLGQDHIPEILGFDSLSQLLASQDFSEVCVLKANGTVWKVVAAIGSSTTRHGGKVTAKAHNAEHQELLARLKEALLRLLQKKGPVLLSTLQARLGRQLGQADIPKALGFDTFAELLRQDMAAVCALEAQGSTTWVKAVRGC